MSPRGKQRNERLREEALGKITRGALSVFAEYGYHGSTMKQITHAAGLSYGLVYHYFASKEAVFCHIVDVALENSQTVFENALNGRAPSWQKLETLSAMLIESSMSSETPILWRGS